MNWSKLPTKKEEAQIANPPVIEDLYGKIEGEKMENKNSKKGSKEEILPPVWTSNESSFLA